MNIAIALNHKYMRYAYVMLTSLLMNQTVPHIHIYVLHRDLTDTDQQQFTELIHKYHHEISFLPIDISIFPDNLPTTIAWSIEAYFRLLLPQLLPAEVTRILYLDVDMIVDKPIDDLYYTDFEDKLFCVCKDHGTALEGPIFQQEIFKEHLAQNFTYFNSGLMLWNIEKIRSKYTFADYMNTAAALNYQLIAPDQDLLNYMHWKEVKFVDEYKYNLFSKLAYNYGIRYSDVKQETSIIHFAGPKPWEGEYIHYDIEQIWWDYAKMTPFYGKLLEEFVYATINNPLVYDTISTISEEKQQLTNELQKSTEVCNKLLQLLNK